MDPLGNRSWKRYYSLDRDLNRELIDNELIKWWKRDDPVVDDILRKNGILSFPHTYLSSSLIPVVRTINAILRSGSEGVLGMGVMHRVSDFHPEREFSLDNFKFILHRACDVLNLDPPTLTEIFLPKEPVDTERPDLTVSTIIDEVGSIREGLTENISIVITGDLVHYGNIYGSEMIDDEPEKEIYEAVTNGLELNYIKKDYQGYFQHSIEYMNDQWAPAMAASMVMGDDLTYEVISRELSDYSEILQSDPPCLVASVFYGVHTNN